jgi:hypothetical protein
MSRGRRSSQSRAVLLVQHLGPHFIADPVAWATRLRLWVGWKRKNSNAVLGRCAGEGHVERTMTEDLAVEKVEGDSLEGLA